MTGPDQERLDRALARAAELVEELRLADVPYGEAADFLAGWAEAVQALRDEGHGNPKGCPSMVDVADCTGCKAITKFCNAVLGEEAES